MVNAHPDTDVAVLTDITADEYEAARAQLKRAELIKRRAVRALQLAEHAINRELGNALIGVRSNGKVVVRVETSEVPEKVLPAHPRRDLRQGAGNAQR